jgi:rare lipoprotein A (peptidoglycan hydrolase)
MASWDGRYWQGRPTASGARSDRSQRTAAHRTASLGTQAVVTTLANGVQITDRGPHTRQQILDLSHEAARRLAMVRTGAARVKVALLVAALPLTSLPGMPSTASPGRGRATLAWQRRRASSGRPAAGSYTPATAGTRPVGRWGDPVCGPSTPPRPHRVLRSHTGSPGRKPEPITRGRGDRP